MKIKKHQSMGGLLALLLFGVFAACILSVLLTGADAYKGLTERDRLSYDRRTAAQYIATRVRQADAADCVSVGAFDGEEGTDTLFLKEEIDGNNYYTRVYCYDGYIRELFSAAGAALDPEDGERILEADSLNFNREGNLLTAELAGADDTAQRVVLFIRSGKEAS